MSINMSGDSSDVDYSDFEYQHVQLSQAVSESSDSTGDGNILMETVNGVEPLADRGGLDNNEVAELVALEVHASVEYEDESADQDVATNAECRGVVGINLPNSLDAFVNTGTTIVDDVSSLGSANGNADVSNTRVQLKSTTDDRKLQQYVARGGPPFDDQTNGPGGNATFENFHNTKFFREFTGRGPVVDANDELSISMSLIVGDIVIDFIGVVRVTAVWDVSTVDDAGRAFSVPSDD